MSFENSDLTDVLKRYESKMVYARIYTDQRKEERKNSKKSGLEKLIQNILHPLPPIEEKDKIYTNDIFFVTNIKSSDFNVLFEGIRALSLKASGIDHVSEGEITLDNRDAIIFKEMLDKAAITYFKIEATSEKETEALTTELVNPSITYGTGNHDNNSGNLSL